ncbi:Selenocysteine lyase [Armadillidium nasatum]|uniref:Selenocysteine lyase n=1 Tax=Armadillidium nasatum TaxID=96803 RepID=A0A5N5SY36_9CRUS|nr:Selenocysteine lyase [Armadillidium nasatum]
MQFIDLLIYVSIYCKMNDIKLSSNSTHSSTILPVNKFYFDYNATTPLAPEVIQTINDSLKEHWGNPSSNHIEGSKAKKALEKAREEVASMISAIPSEILFLSGGTEANNLVLYSAVVHFKKWVISQPDSSFSHMKPHIITTKVEHDSIKYPLLRRYFVEADVTYLGVENLPTSVIDNIRPSTCLITVMLANNETGIMFSVAHIARLLSEVNKKREAEGLFKILLHTDAAQAIGKLPVDVTDLKVDYLTIVGHKFYGPRVGALYVKKLGSGAPLYPLLYGGGQERGYRSGTENTPMYVGLGKACALVQENVLEYSSHMKKMRVYLERQLKKAFANYIKINCVDPCNVSNPEECSIPPSGPKQTHFIFPRLPNTTSVSFYYPEVPVLENSGVCSFHAKRSIRLSVGRETTVPEIEAIVIDIKQAISKALDPLKLPTSSSTSNST